MPNGDDVVQSWQFALKEANERTEQQRKVFLTRMAMLEKAVRDAYLAARGTQNLNDPRFTRSQMYWKGRADAANDVRKLLNERIEGEANSPLSEKHHKAVHILLHCALDELFADYIANHPHEHQLLQMPLKQLLQWSADQTIEPTVP
jgi:hypothetical protein